jgi:maltooligosyltrehalose trehalohydrolase
LVEAVRKGRREEFGEEGEAPDPFAEATFKDCVLRRNLYRHRGTPHQVLHAFYRELIRLRKTVPALVHSDTGTFEVQAREAEQALLVHYHAAEDEALCILSFAPERAAIPFDYPAGEWRLLLNSAAPCWGSKHPSNLPELVSFPTPSPLTLAPQSIVALQKVVNGVSI